LDDKRICRIALYRQGSIDDNDQVLREIMEWAIEGLHSLRDTIGPRVRRLLQ